MKETTVKKILLISNNGMGFYNFKKEFVEELTVLKYETHFAVPNYEKLKELVNYGAYYHEISIDRRGINPIKDFGLIRQFIYIIKKVKPNVIILHTIKPNIYVSFLSKMKKIPYINNITGLGSALQTESTLAIILRFLYRCSLTNSMGIFFENVGNKDYFQHYNIGNKSKYIVVSGAGVNIKQYRPNKKEAADGITFLFIARIMKEKGIEEYLCAAKELKKRNLNIKFQILGIFDELSYKDLINKMELDNTVEYLGTSTDTRIEMLQADCIVLPSYHEGMSNVLLEGASSGLPLITTDIPGCREAIEDGVSGFLCKARDTDSLIQAMEKFINLSPQERLEMGKRGREKMEREFDRRIVIKRYIQCIQSIIGKRDY